MTNPQSKSITATTLGVGNGGRAQGTTGNPPAAEPPSPKIQAVTFALELAKVRSTTSRQATTAEQLIDDAKTIAAFIGQAPAARAFG